MRQPSSSCSIRLQINTAPFHHALRRVGLLLCGPSSRSPTPWVVGLAPIRYPRRVLHRISSCCQSASVGRWSRLNNAAPSVQLHYRAFIPNTSCSVPVRRIGTLILAVLAACDFSLCIGAQVLTFRARAWLSFAPPPCRMPLGPSQASPKLIPEEWPPPGFDIV